MLPTNIASMDNNSQSNSKQTSKNTYFHNQPSHFNHYLHQFQSPSFSPPIQLSSFVEELSQLFLEVFEAIIDSKTAKELMKIVNQMLSMREQMTIFMSEIRKKQRQMEILAIENIKDLKDRIQKVEASLKLKSCQKSWFEFPKSRLTSSVIEKGFDKDPQDARNRDKILQRMFELEQQRINEYIDTSETIQNKQKVINQFLKQQVIDIIPKLELQQAIQQSIKTSLKQISHDICCCKREIEFLRLSIKQSDREEKVELIGL